MAIFVKNILNQRPSINPDKSLKLIHYPKVKQQDVIISDLALLHKDAMPKNSGGLLQMLTHQYTYSIVFTQTEKGEVFLAVLLHQGDDIKESESLFNEIHTTLQPLVRNGSLKLNKALLKESLLPSPLPPNELTAHLVDIMEKHTHLHPQWHKVVQALLHSACSRCSHDEVTKLLSKGGNMEEEDTFGNTPLHSAASEVSAEGLKWLMSITEKKLKKRCNSIKLLSRQNSRGKSAAEIAVESNNYSALSQMMKVGGLPLLFGLPETPKETSTDILHTAARNDSSDSIRVIVEEKNSRLMKRISTMYFSPMKMESLPPELSEETDTSFNILDNDGNTPLMLAVEKGYIRSCIYLLLGEADPNFSNPHTGNTSLHIAVANGHLAITKLLLIFKANPSILNKKGEKPIEKAQPSKLKVFRSIFEEIISALKTSKSSDVIPSPLEPNSVCLLGLDGGGVRCVLLVQTLLAIQDRMKQLDSTSLNPLYYFDYISATGIGCAAPLYTFYCNTTLETCFILSLTSAVSLISDSDRNELIKKEFMSDFGVDTVMADIEYPRIIITSTLADRIPCELHLVTNYGEARNGQKGPKERKVWEAALMTTAAPVYMKPFEGKFIDGGVMVNNPTMDAIVEILHESDKEGKPAKLGCVLSLGTGKPPVQYVDNVAITMPTFSLSSLLDLPNNITAVKNMAGIVMEQLTKSDGEEITRTETICKGLGSSYYRFTPQLKTHVSLAEGDMSKIIDIMYDCHLYLLKETEKIDQIARQLLSRPPNLQPLFRGISA